MGHARRRPHAPQPDRVRGRRQDRLHHQLRVVGNRADGDRAGRASRREGPALERVPTRVGDGRGAGRVLPRRRPRRLPRAVPARDRGGGGGGHPRPRGARRPQRPPRRRGRRPPAGATGRRPVRRRPRDDAAGPLQAPDPRLLDAADLRAADRPQEGLRQDDRAPLPPLPRLRRARVLALPHAQLGSRWAPTNRRRARRARRAARPRRGRRGRRPRARARRSRSRPTAGRC